MKRTIFFLAITISILFATGCSGFSETRQDLESANQRLGEAEKKIEVLMGLVAQLLAEIEELEKDAEANEEAIKETRRRIRELIKDILRDMPYLPNDTRND